MNLYYNTTFKSIKNVFWFAYNSLNKNKYFLYEIQVIFIPSHFSYLLLKWDPCSMLLSVYHKNEKVFIYNSYNHLNQLALHIFLSGTHICIVVKCKGRNNIGRGKEYNKNQSQNKFKTKLSRLP